MSIISIDLGTTNIKVASYTNDLKLIAIESLPVQYERQGLIVEFEAKEYFCNLQKLISTCYSKSKNAFTDQNLQLVLTGQAESLVVIDKDGEPLWNAISWLDMRSKNECEELSQKFDQKLCYKTTGQPSIIPTWPLTKILWMKNNEPECFSKVYKFLLLKDYIIYRLTGKLVGEHSIYPFSHYFDPITKTYWMEPLKYCDVRKEQLPELIPPCSVIPSLLQDICDATDLPSSTCVNVGTLDHFAGMIGTGNVDKGLISESAGTVSSIAAFTENPLLSKNIPFYCGPIKDSYIYLPVCESGGISLEWFKNNFLKDITFDDINSQCKNRAFDDRLIFLPYITGVNPPEFDEKATGVFYGVNAGHDVFDFSLSIMYGVACMLRKNLDHFKASGIKVEKIISTGGGAKSALWCQIKADICNVPVAVPDDEEAPCLGSAIIGAVTAGYYPDYKSAIESSVKTKKIFMPSDNRKIYEKKYELFCSLYNALVPIFHLS